MKLVSVWCSEGNDFPISSNCNIFCDIKKYDAQAWFLIISRYSCPCPCHRLIDVESLMFLTEPFLCSFILLMFLVHLLMWMIYLLCYFSFLSLALFFLILEVRQDVVTSFFETVNQKDTFKLLNTVYCKPFSLFFINERIKNALTLEFIMSKSNIC